MRIEITGSRPKNEQPQKASSSRKRNNKKMEFSKKWLIGCIVFSAFFTAASYVLSIFDKQPLETLASTIIQTLWGASEVSFASYAVQNSVRAYTASRYGLPGGMSDGVKGADTENDCK